MSNLTISANDGSPACVGTYIQGISRTWPGFGETIFTYWEREDSLYWLAPAFVDGSGTYWKITNGADDWFGDGINTPLSCTIGLYYSGDFTVAQIALYVPPPETEIPPDIIYITLNEGSDPLIPDCSGTYTLRNITTTYDLFGATEFPLWMRLDDEFWLEPISGGEEFDTQWAVVDAADMAGAMWSSGNLTMNMPLGIYGYLQGDPGDPYAYSEILVSHAILIESATNTLELTQTLSLIFSSCAAHDTIVFIETLENNIKLADVIGPDIVLTDEALGWNAFKGGTQGIPLTDVVSVEFISSPVLSNLLPLTHSISFIHETCPSPVPKPGHVLLTYPYTTPILTLELPSPEFGDTDTLEARRINRRSRGNTLHIFRDENWPLARRLNFTFLNLSETQKKDLLSFIEVSVGDEIGLLDYEGTQLKVIITTPAATAQQPGVISNSITLQFETVS